MLLEVLHLQQRRVNRVGEGGKGGLGMIEGGERCRYEKPTHSHFLTFDKSKSNRFKGKMVN